MMRFIWRWRGVELGCWLWGISHSAFSHINRSGSIWTNLSSLNLLMIQWFQLIGIILNRKYFFFCIRIYVYPVHFYCVKLWTVCILLDERFITGKCGTESGVCRFCDHLLSVEVWFKSSDQGNTEVLTSCKTKFSQMIYWFSWFNHYESL